MTLERILIIIAVILAIVVALVWLGDNTNAF